jgi:uncharacterized protein (TIGR03067 family)
MSLNTTAVMTPSGAAFNVAVADLSKLSLKPEDSDKFLDDAAQGVAATLPPGTKLTGQGKSTLDGKPAREIVFDVLGKATMKARLAIVGSRLFTLAAVGADKDLQTFFDSFKLTEGASKAPTPASPLDGTWSLVEAKEGGVDTPELAAHGQLVIAGNKLQMQVVGTVAGEADVQFPSPGVFDLRWKTGPLAIQKDYQEHGIYKLDGDTLQMCSGKQRPTKFESPMGTNMTLKRVK